MQDRDGDGLSDEDEARHGTDPSDPDTDDDGLSDGDEVRLSTDPLEADADGDDLEDGDEVRFGTDPFDDDTDGDGMSDSEEIFLGTDPTTPDGFCAGARGESTLESQPVDVILVIDNSSSMSGEIEAVIDRINNDFVRILEGEGDGPPIDYQIILISRHGPIGLAANGCDDHGVCIEPPLAGDVCDPVGPPVLTDRFHQYSVCIDSEDSLRKLVATFDRSPPEWAGRFIESGYFDDEGRLTTLEDVAGGWYLWLRPDASRVFLEITDDESHTDSEDFVEWLYSEDPVFFGTEEEPNWIFHSILGISENTPPDDPWLPSDPIVTDRCEGGRDAGVDYQELSIMSGGLRFSVCRNDNFNVIFRAIAEHVVAEATFPCRYSPEALPGSPPADFDAVIAVYEPGTGPERTLERASDREDCDSGGDYYVDRDAIQLCPDLCLEAIADRSATLSVIVGCETECGNGRVERVEECDDGNHLDHDGCSGDCTLECGDGEVGRGEECDDGNRISGDGCDETCQDECGNFVLEGDEECDDGNRTSGDGCDENCMNESIG